MKFTATLEITVEENALRALIQQAGIQLAKGDIELATLMMAMTHTYRQARAFLLAADHVPMEHGATYLMTDPKDPGFHIMLTMIQARQNIANPISNATAYDETKF